MSRTSKGFIVCKIVEAEGATPKTVYVLPTSARLAGSVHGRWHEDGSCRIIPCVQAIFDSEQDAKDAGYRPVNPLRPSDSNWRKVTHWEQVCAKMQAARDFAVVQRSSSSAARVTPRLQTAATAG